MNLPAMLVRSHCHRTAWPLSASNVCAARRTRGYATHRQSASDLSQSLDTKQRPFQQRSTLGPFALGPSSSGPDKVKKWSELSAGGKVKRTTARTTNLTVILFGAGLSAVLIYCLTSELFSKNSPTVLHDEACDRIKASPQVSKYLHGPLTFHNNPPSIVRPRHRNHHVTSQVFIDANGREHMILNFFVKGRPPGSADVPDTYWEAVSQYASRLSDLTWDDAMDSVAQTWERSKMSFKYLIGSPVTNTSTPESMKVSDAEEGEQEKKKKESAWQVAGMFSALRGSRGGPKELPVDADGRVFTEGEVHADLVRNNDGYFVFRYLLIDIPDSRSRNPVRVFVERGPGVRENEPVMRWNT